MRKKSNGYTFLDMVKDVMEIEKKPLTVAQIWKSGEMHNLTDKIGSKGKTPLNTLQARLYIDIRDNENSIFKQTSKRPSRFFLKNLQCEDGVDVEVVGQAIMKGIYMSCYLHMYMLIRSFVA